jgi:hypothetical protein
MCYVRQQTAQSRELTAAHTGGSGSNSVGSWRDKTTNITPFTPHFNGALNFSGSFVLYGKK